MLHLMDFWIIKRHKSPQVIFANWRTWGFCERTDLARLTVTIAARDDIRAELSTMLDASSSPTGFELLCRVRLLFSKRSIKIDDPPIARASADWLIDLLKAFNYCRAKIAAIILNHASKNFNSISDDPTEVFSSPAVLSFHRFCGNSELSVAKSSRSR